MNRLLFALLFTTLTIAPTIQASAWPASRDLYCELAGADVEPTFVAKWAKRERLEAFHIFLVTEKIEGRTLREWRETLCPPKQLAPTTSTADVLRTVAAKEER